MSLVAGPGDADEFVHDFDPLWAQAGYSTKANAKRVLLRHFKKDEDYLVLKRVNVLNINEIMKGGQNAESIMLKRATVRMFLIYSGTQKSYAFLVFLDKIWQEADRFRDENEDAKRRRLCIDIEYDINRQREYTTEKALVTLHDQVANRIATTLGGIREFAIEHGCIDVLTQEFAIEVKPIEKWRAGLGQALSYAQQTKRSAWLHLFGCTDMKASLRDIINAAAKSYACKVTFEA
jgi:hypothetical protein